MMMDVTWTAETTATTTHIAVPYVFWPLTEEQEDLIAAVNAAQEKLREAWAAPYQGTMRQIIVALAQEAYEEARDTCIAAGLGWWIDPATPHAHLWTHTWATSTATGAHTHTFTGSTTNATTIATSYVTYT